MQAQIKMKGRFLCRHFRGGKLIGTHEFANGVTNEGLNKLLDVMFHATTQIDPWYFGLINNSGYTGLSAGDTMSSHAGWAESTDYDEATRVAFTEAAAASQSIASSAASVFTMNATVTIKGIFVTSVNTKGGTTGTLWATALNTSDISCVAADVLQFSYTVNAA